MAAELFSASLRFFVKDEVSDDLDKIEKNANDTADALDDAGTRGGGNFTSGMAKVSKAAQTGVKAIAGIATAAVGVVGGLMAIATASEETLEDMGKLETAFSVTGWSSEEAQSTFKDFVGILGETDQAVEASNHLAELCNSEEELATWGDIAAGVYAKFGDSLPIEGLTEAANETAKLGQLTGPLADALNWAGVNEDEFQASLDAFNSEAERSALITSTLNGLYKEAGDVYRENNAELIASREAQAAYSQALAKVGEAAMPVKTAILEIGATLLNKLLPYIEKLSAWITENLPSIQQKITDTASSIIGVLGTVFAFIQPALTVAWGLIKSILDLLPTFLPLIAGLGAATGVIMGIVNAIKAWKTITTAMRTAQLLLNAAMAANPIGLVIAIVAGLVAAIVTLWNTNEGFRNAIIGAWEGIKNAISSVINFIKGLFQGLGSVVSSVWNGITTTISNAINGARNAVQTAINAIKGIFNFSWSLPHLNLPHISVSGGKAPWGIAGKGSLPSFSIDWYAKGAIFDAATLLPTNNGASFAGVGEAGAEAVAPISDLLDMMKQAISDMNIGGGGYVSNVTVNTGETDENKLARLISREQKRQAYALGAL